MCVCVCAGCPKVVRRRQDEQQGGVGVADSAGLCPKTLRRHPGRRHLGLPIHMYSKKGARTTPANPSLSLDERTDEPHWDLRTAFAQARAEPLQPVAAHGQSGSEMDTARWIYRTSTGVDCSSRGFGRCGARTRTASEMIAVIRSVALCLISVTFGATASVCVVLCGEGCFAITFVSVPAARHSTGSL